MLVRTFLGQISFNQRAEGCIAYHDYLATLVAIKDCHLSEVMRHPLR
jgi:hypothetical protein